MKTKYGKAISDEFIIKQKFYRNFNSFYKGILVKSDSMSKLVIAKLDS